MCDEDPDGHLGTLGDPHDRQNHEHRQQPDRAGDLRQPIPQRPNIVHRFDGRDDRGGHVGEQRQAGGDRRAGLAGGVQQRVVGTAVEWQGPHDLGVDLAEQVQHRRDDQQREWREMSGGHRGQRRDIQATGRDVVAADGRRSQLPQLLVTAWRLGTCHILSETLETGRQFVPIPQRTALRVLLDYRDGGGFHNCDAGQQRCDETHAGLDQPGNRMVPNTCNDPSSNHHIRPTQLPGTERFAGADVEAT